MAKKKEENAAVETEETKAKFREKLKSLLELGKKKRNILEYQEISDFFRDMNLDEEKMEKVLDFLEANKVDVLRISDGDDEDDDIILDDEDEVEVEKIDIIILIIPVTDPEDIYFICFQEIQNLLHLFFVKIHIPEKIADLLILQNVPFLFSQFQQTFQFFSELCLCFFRFHCCILFFFLCHVVSSSQVTFYFVPNQ